MACTIKMLAHSLPGRTFDSHAASFPHLGHGLFHRRSQWCHFPALLVIEVYSIARQTLGAMWQLLDEAGASADDLDTLLAYGLDDGSRNAAVAGNSCSV